MRQNTSEPTAIEIFILQKIILKIYLNEIKNHLISFQIVVITNYNEFSKFIFCLLTIPISLTTGVKQTEYNFELSKKYKLLAPLWILPLERSIWDQSALGI